VRQLWKKLQLGVIAGLTVLATGCGGLRAGYGVTPLTILFPGLGFVKAEPKPAKPGNKSVIDEQSKELAQTRNSQISKINF
jgi:hypothetical protein